MTKLSLLKLIIVLGSMSYAIIGYADFNHIPEQAKTQNQNQGQAITIVKEVNNPSGGASHTESSGKAASNTSVDDTLEELD